MPQPLLFSSVAPLKSLYFHWTAICSSSIVFMPHSLFLLFVLLFSGLIMEDLTTAATSPLSFPPKIAVMGLIKRTLLALKIATIQDFG